MRDFSIALLMSIASLASFTAAHADVEIDGVKYATPLKLDGKALQLNGVASRYGKLGARNFTVAVYASEKARTGEGLLAAPGSKRIAFKFLRSQLTDGLRIMTRGVETNLERGDFAKALGGVARLGGLMGSRQTFAEGDTFTMDYQPGVGTFFTVNGKRDPEPVKEPEFFKAMLLVWVGENPVDAQMKAAILGG